MVQKPTTCIVLDIISFQKLQITFVMLKICGFGLCHQKFGQVEHVMFVVRQREVEAIPMWIIYAVM